MKIARIIEYFPPHIGGMERHGLILSQEQIKLGHKVDVFIGYGDKKLLPLIYKAPIYLLPLYSKVRRFWFNYWAYFAVNKRHKKNPYDIIHLHGDFVEAYFGGKLSKKLNIPAVLTIHAGLNKKLLNSKNAKYFENIRKIICVSNEIAEDLKSIGVPDDKLNVISSGIYLDDFKNVDEDKIVALRNQYIRPIIISVGVLRVNKGFKYLIEAFKSVKKQFSSATLLIVGDGPDRNKLETQVQNITGVYFLGRQNHDKVIEYLKIADIFVLASISTDSDREGTPTSIMEAMAAGLPVVATNVGGVADLVKNARNGFVVDPANSSELAIAIMKLIKSPGISGEMSVKNLEDIKQKDWPAIAKSVIEVYETIF